jgi:5-methylcytosine-specific restriction enzyme A
MARGRALSPAVLRQRRGIGTKATRALDPGAISRAFGGDGKPGPKPDPTRKPRRQDRRWQAVQAAQLEREPYCRLCTAEGKQQVQAFEVDHITPLANGGAFDDPTNLQSLCRPCHWQKTEDENAARGRRKPRRVARVKGCDPATGMPLDPEHWWNQT